MRHRDETSPHSHPQERTVVASSSASHRPEIPHYFLVYYGPPPSQHWPLANNQYPFRFLAPVGDRDGTEVPDAGAFGFEAVVYCRWTLSCCYMLKRSWRISPLGECCCLRTTMRICLSSPRHRLMRSTRDYFDYVAILWYDGCCHCPCCYCCYCSPCCCALIPAAPFSIASTSSVDFGTKSSPEIDKQMMGMMRS